MTRKLIKSICATLLASTTMLYPAQAIAMPMAIAGAILPFVVSSPVFFLGPAAISAVAMGIGYAAVIGASLALQYALTPRPRPPKPEDVQTNFRQATPVRSALYGEGLLGGPWVYGNVYTAGGRFYRIIALSSRQLTAIDEIWIDDIPNVSFDGNPATGAFVNGPAPYTGGTGSSRIRVEYRLGLPTETHYADITNEIPEWTADHRGDGIASIYTQFSDPDAEDIQKYFPQGVNTLVRAKCRGVRVWNPVTNAINYSDNLARVILDYMRHPDGFRIPDSLLLTPKALAGWQQAVTDSNDAIPLAAGGTEPRYRCWGVYNYNERPADVLMRFMQAGNARLKPVSDGGYTLEVGKWRAPTVTIDASMIVGFDGLARGRDIMQTANTVYAQFQSVDHEYQSTDAQPWIDEADVAERGEISISQEYINAPSHGQCRRLMKIEARRANPADVGTIVCSKAGVIAYGERFINIDFPDMELVGTFEVMDFQFVFGEHGILKGCSLTVQSISASAYDWNAATEEGAPGGLDNPPADNPYAPPTGFDVTMEAGEQALVEWEPSGSPAFATAHIEYENLTNPAGTEEIFVASEDEETTITGLAEDDDYRFRMRFRASISSTDWTDWITRTAIA